MSQTYRILVTGAGRAGMQAVNYIALKGVLHVEYLILDSESISPENSLGHNIICIPDLAGTILSPEPENSCWYEKYPHLFKEISDHLVGVHLLIIIAAMNEPDSSFWAPELARLTKEKDTLTIGIPLIPVPSVEIQTQTTESSRQIVTGTEGDLLNHWFRTVTPFRGQGVRTNENQNINFPECTQIPYEKGMMRFRVFADFLIPLKIDESDLRAVEQVKSGTFHDPYFKAWLAVKTFTGIVYPSGVVSVDFYDLVQNLRNGGEGIIGFGSASGENRTADVVKNVLASSGLDLCFKTAGYAILNIAYGKDEILLVDIKQILELILDAANPNMEIIWDCSFDPDIEQGIRITLIAERQSFK